MAARIKEKMERTSSWSYLCRRVGFRAEKRTIGLRLIVTLKVVNSRQTAFGILPITKSSNRSSKENFQIGHQSYISKVSYENSNESCTFAVFRQIEPDTFAGRLSLTIMALKYSFLDQSWLNSYNLL